MNAPRKKLLIIAQIAPRQIGSYERYHFGVVGALEARGWEVVSAFSGAPSAPVRDHFGPAAAGVVADLGDAGPGPSRAAWIDLLRREQPAVVWIHFFATNGGFARAIRRALPRSWVVVTDHISRGRVRRGPLREVAHRLRRFAARGWVDRHIAVSRFVADRLVASDRVPAARVQLIYNGVDLDSFRQAPPATAEGYAITVCYMRPEKGVDVLLRALAILQRAGVEPRFLVVGDGPGLAGYREAARGANLPRVEFLGHRNDVAELLHGATFAVVPSVWPEAFSFVAAEAQASGIPVVASAIGGLREVVADGVTGLLAPPGDAEALAAAIGRLHGDPAARSAFGRAGRDRVATLFALADKVRETADYFEALVARARPGR